MFAKPSVRKARFFLALALLVFGWASRAPAQQRVFATVNPNAGDPAVKLTFDTNVDFTDNISPNIIVTPDDKRAFVGYAGSGVVLSFSMEDGTILNRISTGGKPQWGTLLPDHHTLAFVSVLDNKIFIIDADSYTLTATYSIANAFFGFGSLLTVSSDGSVGYISSTGSGEVVKFSLTDGKELGRLKGLEGPAQITLSSDGSILMIVDTMTEELLFVDAATMVEKSSIKAKEKVTVANFTIFNKAVLSPDGSTGIVCSRDLNGILGVDTAFHFKTSTGELLDTIQVGSEPGFTGLSPDGLYWYVLNGSSVTRIPVADVKTPKDVTTVKGAPLGSANIVFSPDSKYAYYTATDANLVFQHELSTTAVVGQLKVGFQTNAAALIEPSSLAITSDGKTVAVLEYIINGIELLTSASVMQSAKFVSSPTKFTGLALINLSSRPNKCTVVALDIYGQLLSETGINNPVEYNLQPNEQISLVVSQIFNFDDSKERTGWLAIFSEQPEVTGYLSTGDRSLNRLDGVPLFKGERFFDWIVPEVVRKGTQFAELHYVNPSYNQTTYSVTYYGPDGAVRLTKASQPAYPTNRQSQVFGEQYTTPAETTDGYLRNTSELGLIFTEYFGGDNAMGGLNGINVAKYNGVTRLYSPQFAVIPGFKTILNVINANAEDADITVTLHRPDGSAIGQPYKTKLVKNAQLKGDLATIFKNDPAVVNVTGWLEVTSTKDRIVGAISFTNEAATYLTSFELLGTPLNNMIFPTVAQNEAFGTGVALLNNNPDPASVHIELWTLQGGVNQQTTITLSPRQETAVYLTSLFPQMGPSASGNIRIRSDKPLFAFALINDLNLHFLTALPAIPLP